MKKVIEVILVHIQNCKREMKTLNPKPLILSRFTWKLKNLTNLEIILNLTEVTWNIDVVCEIGLTLWPLILEHMYNPMILHFFSMNV